MRKQLNKIILLTLFFVSYYVTGYSQSLPASCSNLDFSQGNFNNWTGATSENHSGTLDPIVPGLVPGRHTIISAGQLDPYTCDNTLTLPPNTPFCARLGNGGINPTPGNPPAWNNGVLFQVDYLSYTFMVSPSSALLTYKYAVVLQDPNNDPNVAPHGPNVRPKFSASILDPNGNLTDPTCGYFEAVVDSTVPGFRNCSLTDIQTAGGNPSSPAGTVYKAWTTVGVDLRNYINQTITLQFETRDCGYGGHFGYAYVTARCDSFTLKTEVCNGLAKISAPDGFSYNWYPNGETTKDIYINNAAPGDSVYVEMTSVNGCQTSLWTKIYPAIVNPNFTTTVTTVCLNTAVQFSDSSYSYYTQNNAAIPITSWDWKFGDGQTSTGINTAHTYTAPGVYTACLIVANQTGCTDSIKKNINVLPMPIADFLINDACVNSVASFTNTASVPSPQSITNYTWTFSDNTNTNNTFNTSRTFNVIGNYTVNLTVQTNMGCVHDTAKTLKIWPLPQANFTGNNVCLGDSTQFNNLSLSFDVADNIANWVWDFDDNMPFSSLKNPKHLYFSDNTYSVQLTATTGRGCSKDTVIPVIVHPIPQANFLATPVCRNTPTQFTDLSTPNAGIASWNWTFGDLYNNTSTDQNPTHTYTLSNLFLPTLTVTSSFGCVGTTTIAISIPPLPDVDFNADKYNGCAPLCVNFINLSYSGTDPITKWSWDFGDGNTSNLKEPPHCYTNDGVYTVSLSIETANTCKESHQWNNMITVYPYPTANFEASPYETSELTPKIEFISTSIDAYNWRWNFGDNTSGSSYEKDTHYYTGVGTYNVWLHIKNQFGCKDSISKSIVINPEWSFYVPNAFTPSSTSGVNDSFGGYGLNISNYEMWIYDRWGEQIYFTNDIYKQWNGKAISGANQDKVVQQDVYVWKIRFNDIHGKRHEHVGHVTLLK